jgi:hypothetical protein
VSETPEAPRPAHVTPPITMHDLGTSSSPGVTMGGAFMIGLEARHDLPGPSGRSSTIP